MESPRFKDPQPPEESVSDTSNSVINTERSETPDSNKGLQDNDSVTNSPKISKPVLGKAQAKKRLMAFVNKFNAVPKIQKSTDKNEISTRDPNSIKKKSIENTESFKGSSKQLDRKMEDCSDLPEIEHQPGKKMKKRSEQKVLAIDEIIREDARHKEWLAKNTSENQLLLERMTKDGYARNRDRDRYSDRRSRNDQRRRKPRFDNRRDHDRRNWRGSNNQRSRRQSPTDKRGNSALDQNMPSRKISLERSGVIDQKNFDKKRPQSSERRDDIKIKEKKDPKIGNERCRSKSNDADKQSKFKDDSKFSTKSQNEKTKDNSQTIIHTKSCNNWRDFKNGGGFVRGKSLSIEPPKLPGKDLKSKTAQEYDMYLKQMLITDNNRFERSLVVANATIDGQQKEYPPESIRVTKNSKIVPIFYCGNPNVSLFMSRREVLEYLPPERCKTIRAIAENTQNPSTTSQVEVEPKNRVWFERLKLTNEEEELPKKSSPMESPILRKSRWDNGDEIASKPIDEVLPKELENIPTKSVSPGITLETRILTPSTANKEEENIPLVEKFDDLAEENTVKTNENLASEYEQFMKIVTNDTSTVATLDDCYSSDESTSKTPPPSPSQAEYHQNLTPLKIEKTTPMEFDSIDYLVDDKSLDKTKKIDESFLKKPETASAAVIMDKTIEVSEKNEKENIEIQLPLGNIVIKNERLSDEAISNSEETINIRKIKKKIASSSESSDSSSTSLSENEVRRKKLKRRRRKKRTKESSTMSSSSSSDSSSDEMNSRKRRKVRRKKKNKRSKLSKKRSRRDSSFSDSSNTSLENNLKRRKITAAKHSKISEERRSQSMEKFQLRKIKKEKEDIVEIVKDNIEVPAEVTIKTVIVPSEVKEIVEQVDIKDENNEAIEQRVNEIELEKVEENREIVKNLEDKSDDQEIENTDVEKLNVEVPVIIMEEKQEKHEIKKITNIKEELPEISSTVESTTNESEQHEKTVEDSVEKILEKPSDEIVEDGQETIQIQKSDSRRRRHSTSSSSSSFTSSSVDSTSTLTSENTRSSSKSRRKLNKGQKASRHRRSKPKKLMKNNDKWGSQLDFDSLHSLNFPSLTQLEQRVGKNLDDWEVDSMDGVREFAASTSRDKSKRLKKVEKEVRYDEKTDTYISVEKETPRGSKKKIPDRKCSLRIWEDEEEEGEREAILLLKDKDEKNSEKNLKNWLPGGERFPQVSKIEIKKKEESIMIQPEISPKQEKTESNVWIEVHPDAIPLPENSASKGKIKKSRWSNVTSPAILESPKTPDTPEGSLVPVNWEEEEVVWPEPIKSQDIKQSRSKLDIDKLVVKKLEINVDIDKHDSINTEGSSVYSANSPTLSQKLDTAEPSSDSSSDSSDSSSTSESSDSDGDSENEESPKFDDIGNEMNTFSPDNNSRISFTKEDSKDFLMKDTDDDLEYSESDTMKKLRMNMFHQFSGKNSDKLTTPVELNDAVKSSVDSLSPKSTLKLIPNMLLARRPVDVLTRSPQFKLDQFPSTQSTDLGEQFDIPTSDSSTSVPKLENQENSPQKQVFRNTFTEITSQDSRSSLSAEQRRRLSPRRDRDESRKSINQDRGINSNYQSIALSISKDLDRDNKGKFESRESRPGRSSSPRDRRRFSPDDRKFQRRSPAPRYRGRSRSASRSWSRSRSRSPRRDGKWERQKRCRYSDEGRDKFSRSPGRGRPFGPKDRTPDKKSPEIKPYDPMEMLRNAASSKQRENEAAERARRLEESNINRDESVTLDNLYSSRIKSDIGVGSVFDERQYPRDSLDREIIEGPTTSTFDGPSRPRYRSRSLERRSRDGDWDRSRESSVSDRLRRERRSSPNRRLSKSSRLLSPPRRALSPLRKRFISRSRSRSWSKSRSSSRSRSRSRSISKPRLRSRSPSPSRSRTRLRGPERRRSLDRFRRSRSRSITRSRSRSRSRSYSPRRRRSRSLERFPERIITTSSGETGRRIETIVHPSGMNPPPPEVTTDITLSRDSNVTAPFHYPTERVGDYPYYPRNNLTYPPRMEEASLNTGSPKRLSLDDRLELELGIKKSQEGGLSFNRPNFNPHMMVFPSPPPGIAPIRCGAPIVPPLGHIPPIRRNQPTVLQVGNVLQVVPADFNGPVVPQTIRNNETPSSSSSPNTNNANRVVRVGNVLQVVPTTNVDWTGSGTPIIDRLPSVQYPPPSPSTLAVNPAVPIITSVPIPTAVPAPSIIPSSPRTMALPPLPTIVPTIPLLSPAIVPPEIKPVQAPPQPPPPPIPFAVYNYDAIMETRRKEKEERKKLRDERRREKERRKMEKIRRRTKRIMGRTGRVQVLAEQDLALELNSDVSTVIAEEIQKIIVNNEEDELKTVNEVESIVVAPEVDDDEDDEEDEEGEVEEDEENGEEEPEEETPEPVETEENCEDDSQKVVLNCGEQIDIENSELIESTSGIDVENISASVSAIVIQPTPKKGILVAPGLWDKKLLNGDSDDGDINHHVENADDDSLLSNDNFMVGWDIDEDKDDLENGRERNTRTPRRNRSKKAVQFADGVKPGEGTSPSGGEGDMPSPPPPASTSDQDPMEEFGKRTRNRKDSRKKGKRAKPPKTKKKVKVKIIKLKKPKITPLTAAMLDDSDEVDDRSPPPPPPGSPPPPELWPDYLSTYNPATAQSTEMKSPSPSTSQEPPPPTPLPLLVPPPPLNYTIQPCNKA